MFLPKQFAVERPIIDRSRHVVKLDLPRNFQFSLTRVLFRAFSTGTSITSRVRSPVVRFSTSSHSTS